MLNQAVRGFTEDDFKKEIGKHNPVIWIIGHLILCRQRLMKTLGHDIDIKESAKQFDMGSKIEDLDHSLTGKELLEEFNQLHQTFMKFLDTVSEETLAQPIERELPNMPKTKEASVQFLNFHETYHLGQLGSLRRIMGKDSLLAGTVEAAEA